MAICLSLSSLLISLLAASTTALPSNSNKALIKRTTPTAFADRSPDVESKHYLALKSGGPSRSSKLLASKQNAAKLATTSASAQLSTILEGTEFIVPVEIYNEKFYMIVDTGSSDTWVPRKGFQCYNVTETGYYDYELNKAPESTCDFGATYNGSFEGGQIANENFNITYGSGEFVTGVVGKSHVTVAGLTVVHQEIALATQAYFQGDGVSSGIMGLAFEALTSAFKGTNPAVDNPNSASSAEHYSPIFQSMYTQGLTTPLFSLALERTNSTSYSAPGGYIAFGGYPPVSFTQSFTSTPIDIVQVSSIQASNQPSFYAITPDGWVGGRAGSSTKVRRQHHSPSSPVYIVDSGTTLIYAPSQLAREIAELFTPAAEYIEEFGAYVNLCSATPPALGVQINGTAFYINPNDLLLKSGEVDEDGEEICVVGVQDGGEGPYILGDVWLQNVVAVFDVGASEMRFAAHENY